MWYVPATTRKWTPFDGARCAPPRRSPSEFATARLRFYQKMPTVAPTATVPGTMTVQ